MQTACVRQSMLTGTMLEHLLSRVLVCSKTTLWALGSIRGGMPSSSFAAGPTRGGGGPEDQGLCRLTSMLLDQQGTMANRMLELVTSSQTARQPPARPRAIAALMDDRFVPSWNAVSASDSQASSMSPTHPQPQAGHVMADATHPPFMKDDVAAKPLMDGDVIAKQLMKYGATGNPLVNDDVAAKTLTQSDVGATPGMKDDITAMLDSLESRKQDKKIKGKKTNNDDKGKKAVATVRLKVGEPSTAGCEENTVSPKVGEPSTAGGKMKGKKTNNDYKGKKAAATVSPQVGEPSIAGRDEKSVTPKVGMPSTAGGQENVKKAAVKEAKKDAGKEKGKSAAGKEKGKKAAGEEMAKEADGKETCGLVLGCSKCRGAPKGCARCRDPSFGGRRGPL